MTACLVGPLPAEEMTEDVAVGQQYRLINGNHRIAALLQLAGEQQDGESSRLPAVVEVEVHAGLSLEQERLVASSEYCDWALCVLQQTAR